MYASGRPGLGYLARIALPPEDVRARPSSSPRTWRLKSSSPDRSWPGPARPEGARPPITGLLRPGAGRSFCEWKDRVACFNLRTGGRTAPDAAWSCPDPVPAFTVHAGHLAFNVGQADARRVGGITARRQPGGFHGGRATPNLTRIVKGGRGTEG
ncbi:hypothetical protein CCR90_01550 [Rhodovulum sulfidophilum]|uniref:DUF427 domain-containing protein n=1 Tax=Rhodovulum sulfidophilum TaxID=35806 RepID=UPI00237AEF45|nr:DUF427 domain-containing protein [Rhodovulum sulfidophilum]MBK5922482.1 hypothetical protein [Rhodovulum sulfidophilum]